MKLAIVCDDLIQNGGQERLIMAISDLWPQAPIYASVISKNWQERLVEKKRNFKYSFAQRLPFVEKINRYYSPFLVHILAFESFDFSEFDVVLSVSARYAHFIVTKPETKHICYMNSPGRMFWNQSDYFKNETYGKLEPIKFLAIPFLTPFLSTIRQLDYAASHRVDFFIANSVTAQNRISKYYGRDSVVISPFVDTSDLRNAMARVGEYFLVITRLVSWKNVEIAILACKELGLKLHIIGEGPDKQRLEKLADESITFLGYVNEEMKVREIEGCLGLINTQQEDFGIVPLEAMACGKPVIAFGKGGVLETVLPEKTGEFFYSQTPEALLSVLKTFDSHKYLSQTCKAQAGKFDKSVFEQRIKQFVELS